MATGFALSLALHLFLFLSACLGDTSSDKTHAGQVIHEVPEFYEDDGVTLKPSSGKRAIRFFTGRPEWGPGTDVMGFVIYLFKEALRDINRRTDILPDYVVELHLSNSLCSAPVSVQTTVKALSRNPTGFFHLIFGPGCSGPTAVVNDLIQPFNLLQIAPLSRSPSLANRARYPFMCRTAPPLQFGSIGIARMCKLFGWSRIGAVSDPSGLTKATVSIFMGQVEAEAEQGYAFDLPWMSSATRVIQNHGQTSEVLLQLREVGVRVLVIAFYEDYGIRFLCEMFRHRFYGSNLQAILATTWWGDTWIREQVATQPADMHCSLEQLFEAATGMISLGQTTFFPSATLRHGITGFPLSEIKATYATLCRDPDAEGCRADFASYDYDGLALAVHVFHVWLHEHGHSLSEIDYLNEGPRQQLFQIAVNSSFVGTSGLVSFFNDSVMACERKGTFSIKQYLPFATAWGDYGWSEVTSYKHDAGFGTFMPWSPIKWADGSETFMGEGSGFGTLVAAPGTKRSFGNAVGLENVPHDRLDCAVGHRPNSNRSACEECPAGRAAGSVGSWTCEPCGRGTFAASKGSGSCSFCPPGTHQASPGASSCDDCPAGTVSDPLALWQCLSCAPGSFTSEKGQSECSRCLVGSYSDRSGRTDCTECEGAGMTTKYMAATSPQACHCTEGTYREDRQRECQDCPEGMMCLEGADVLNFPKFAGLTTRSEEQQFPLLRRGYMSFGAEPLSVYQCIREDHCPGHIPGQACAAGRDGVACGQCFDGYAEASGGRCEHCDPGETALPSIIGGIAAVVIIAVSTLNVNTNWQTISSSVVLFLTVAGILVANLQTMTVFRRSALKWEFPLSTVLKVISVVSFEIDGLKANCVLGSDPVMHYIVRQCVVPMCVPLILATLLIKRWWVPASLSDIGVQVSNTVGTLCNLFFISIVVSAVSSMYCYQHPGGMGYSMVSNPSVRCFDSSSHTTMLIVTVVAVLCVPVPYAATVVLATYGYPSMVTSNAPNNLLIMRAMRFLFFRFHRHRYYYGLILLARNAAICFVPVIFRDHVGLQIALLCATLSSFTIAQQQLAPWLSPVANIVDGTMAQLMVMMLVSGVMATPNLQDSAGFIGIASFTILSMLAASTLVYATCKLGRERRGYYHMFICHHKAAAAAQARYLKILLEQTTKRSIFIDSDDLTDLQQLFDIVRRQVKQLVVYLTRLTMSRPWCAGEIATAIAHNIETIGVITPSYTRPSDLELCDPATLIEDFAAGTLEEHGVSVEMLTTGLRQFLDQDNFVQMHSGDRGRGRLKGVAAQLVGKQASIGGGPIQLTPGTVVISADPLDDEGIAAAGILASEIKLEVVRRTWVQICFLADHEEDFEAISSVVLSSTALLVLLSRGSLESLPQLVAIVEVMSRADLCRSTSVVTHHHSRSSGHSKTSVNSLTKSNSNSPARSRRPSRVSKQQGPCVIPVHIPGFVFPQKDYYEHDLPRVWSGRACYAQECVRLFFEKIAVVFPVHASDKVISSHTAEILERIDYRRKSIASAADRMQLSNKAKSWAEIPDDDSDFEPPFHSCTSGLDATVPKPSYPSTDGSTVMRSSVSWVVPSQTFSADSMADTKVSCGGVPSKCAGNSVKSAQIHDPGDALKPTGMWL